MTHPFRILSLCTGMGLLDRALLDEGFDVVAGCEIDPEMREMYAHLCGGSPLTHRLEDLSNIVNGWKFDAVVGGPPCQSHTRLRAIRAPKFNDLTQDVVRVLKVTGCHTFLFENVVPLLIDGARHSCLNAMHFGQPHQSRARWFTHSFNIRRPKLLFVGSVDDLMAYSVVAGRIYGPKRAARLQGYPMAAELPMKCQVLQKGLSNAVHYGLARAWAERLRMTLESNSGE